MQKLAKKWISRRIIKILKYYQKTLENDKLIFKSYLEQTIYFEIEYIIKLIKERNENNGRNG